MSSSLLSSEGGPKFRVAICGAGIAGLVLAITIGKYDPSIPIDLYEAHDSIDTAGVGIVMWRRTHEIMIELGLLNEFEQIFTQNPGSTHGPCMRRSDIREGGYIWYQRTHRYRPTSMHRQHMVAILEKHLPASCTVHARKRLVGFTEPEQQDGHPATSIILSFADGNTATTDVLIGADGIRSAVRKTLFEAASEENNGGNSKTDPKQYIEATFTGITIYRFLIPTETLKKEDPDNVSLMQMTGYHGRGRYLLTYLIANGTIINVAVMIANPTLSGTRYDGHWVSDASHEEIAGYFDNFEPSARAIVKLCEKPSRWALHVVKPLPFCVRERVGLIGDACHATTPHLGIGAGQAIEDAFVLGRLIAHPLTTLPRIPEALRIYEEIRLPFVRSLASLSLSMGWLYMFMEPGHYDGTRRTDDLDENGVSAYEKEGMERNKNEINRRLDSIELTSGALQAWENAESKLKAVVGQMPTATY